MGRAVKNSLEIVIKQVRLEGGFKRGGRIRVAECLRQIVPDRWASIRKRSFFRYRDSLRYGTWTAREHARAEWLKLTWQSEGTRGQF